MRRPLNDDEFFQQIFGAEQYAWRWEQQPVYRIPREQDRLAAFLEGKPEPPTDNPNMIRYLEQVRRMVQVDGRRLGRVRVIDDPPTGYQRWLQWMAGWSRAAGEEILYLPRPVLEQMGRPPLEPDADWWLIDGERLIVMRFEDGRFLSAELVVDEPEIRLARLWRLAVISWAIEEQEIAAAAASAAA